MTPVGGKSMNLGRARAQASFPDGVLSPIWFRQLNTGARRASHRPDFHVTLQVAAKIDGTGDYNSDATQQQQFTDRHFRLPPNSVHGRSFAASVRD